MSISGIDSSTKRDEGSYSFGALFSSGSAAWAARFDSSISIIFSLRISLIFSRSSIIFAFCMSISCSLNLASYFFSSAFESFLIFCFFSGLTASTA